MEMPLLRPAPLARRAWLLGSLPWWAAACSGLRGPGDPLDASGAAAAPPAPATASPGPGPAPSAVAPAAPAEAWQPMPLPGKRATRYATGRKDGRVVVHARAEGSASMWRRRTRLDPALLGAVRFSWRVDALNPAASVADIDHEDAVARLVFAFDGDRARLSPRTRAMFDLAQALGGEAPPFATLMYVWDTKAALDSVIVNPRTDRIRKIVVDAGPSQLGRWREHRRDLVADYQRAFGEPPGPLLGVALMTDSDNTGARAEAWYGPVSFEPPGAAGRGREA
jgi:hypothetical protein